MKAVVFEEHGVANVLKPADLPNPEPGPGEVLVDVRAAGLNHLDIWVRQGMPGLKIPMPHISGSDASGVIKACGQGVQGVQVGERVIVSPGMGCGLCEHCAGGWDSLCDDYHLLGLQVNGTYANRLVVPERRVIKVSDKYSFEEWASVSLVFLTAWHMLHTHAGLKTTDKVLIHAAGSGIGSAAIQIAALSGAKIFTTVGSIGKVEKALALGAHHVIRYREKDFSEEINRLTDGKGVDLIFEHIGPDTWVKNLSCMAKGGRLVTCGATSGPQVQMDLRFFFMKQHKLMGSYMGSRKELLQVVQLLEEGKLKPVLDKVFPLHEAKEAQEYMESRSNFGKIVLKMDE